MINEYTNIFISHNNIFVSYDNIFVSYDSILTYLQLYFLDDKMNHENLIFSNIFIIIFKLIA